MESLVGKQATARWRGHLAVLPYILVAGLLLLPEPAVSIDERKLAFYHSHTAKRLDVVYARGGEYVESALDDVERFLSDFRTGDRKTIDVRLRDVSLKRLRDAAVAMKRGGVGYYEASNFVHLDTGRVRRR